MDEEKKELKLVDVSFVASLKFWLAYLIVQIIAMMVVFSIMLAVMTLAAQIFRGFVPQILPRALALFNFL